jgi:flagellar hook protein FlgE
MVRHATWGRWCWRPSPTRTALLNLGNNQWNLTSLSGPELVGAPASGSRGVIQSAAVEDSNVDLTKELVDMITAQRNYQANAQTIKTQDAIMQTLVNLR